MSAFRGFTPDAMQFLVELALNNGRSWFQPRKAEYERLLKQPLEALCSDLAIELERRDIPLRADPRSSPFRLYRDTRFSKDKTPYKTHVAASFPWIGGARRGPSGVPSATAAATYTSHRTAASWAAACGDLSPGG